MNYPVWDVAFGSQWLIIIVAVTHVFVSHFAIGGGLFLVAMETRARKHDDDALLGWLKGHSRVFLLATVVFGAVSGVGIWFVIGLISPEATSNLIHSFVWGWAIEWVFFLVEILAILVYYYKWDTMAARTHLKVGWVYFIAAYMSLVVINGIVSFQLTPGTWLETKGFWNGFFNPTYWPSLVVRTLICIMLGGLWAILTATFQKDRILKSEIARYASHWVWIPALGLAPAIWWYLHKIPQAHKDAFTLIGYLQNFVWAIAITSGVLVLLTFLVVTIRPRWATKPLALLLLLLAFMAFGSFEWIREDLRKPYIITGYTYANQIPVRQVDSLLADGLLASSIYVSAHEFTPKNREILGEELFRITCGPCHRPNMGFNALAPKLQGLDEAFVAGLVAGTGHMRGRMPPFVGKNLEAKSIAAYLMKGVDSGAADNSGPAVWRRRCGSCHSLRGEFRPVIEAFEDQTPEDIAETIQYIEYMSELMPPWSGSDAEKGALAKYLSEQASEKGGDQ